MHLNLQQILIENNTYCKNCESELTEAYCQSCGQRSSVGKVTFKETFQDFFATVFSLDAPFVKTLKLLFSNPGKLFRSYLSGQRKSYYKPVAFFILITLAHVLIRSLLDFNPLAKVTSLQNGNFDTTIFVESGRFMIKNINNILFLFVFSMAISFKIFFYNKHSLAEYVAVSFYLIGTYSIITTLNLFFMKFINAEIQYLAVLLMGIYFILMATSFFQKKKIFVAFKAVFAYFIAFLLYFIFGFGLSFLIVFFKVI